MATDVNKITRKRKSASDLIFEVNETDCSPASTPEPVEESASCSISETEASSQASTDVSKVSTVQEDMPLKPEVVKSDVDLRCMDMEVESSPPPNTNNNKPIVSLIFRDNDVAKRLKSKIVGFIKGLVNFEISEDSETDSSLRVDLWESNFDCLDSSVVKPENDDLFVVDTTPSKSREILPRYIPNHCDVIEELDPNNVNGNVPKKDPLKFRPQTACFNCEGNHAMKDCKEMKDYRRISIARNKYMNSMPAKSVRYHLDDEQKYEHIKPGKISEKLRRALDIRKYELPPYVYRMRMLGYPPGWLQEAMITDSKLELFDFEGCAVGDGSGDNRVIDASKIIEYPGFNVPVEKGIKDQFKYYQCPPFNENHSKQSMLTYIENMANNMQLQQKSAETPLVAKPPPAKVPRQCEESDSNSQGSECAETKVKRSISPSLNDLEMRKRQLLAELEDGSLNSPQPNNGETLDKTFSAAEESLKKAAAAAENSLDKPTAADEESLNKIVPAAESLNKIVSAAESLNKIVSDEESLNTIVSTEESLNKNVSAEESLNKIVPGEESLNKIVPDEESLNKTIPDEESLNKTTPAEESLASPSVMSSAFGTPVLKSASPYMQLPDRDKFSKDISQVINFENLPNSTGKYEQMTKVISKVRDTVKGASNTEQKKS